jgi:T1SS-143 domain-containing protein
MATLIGVVSQVIGEVYAVAGDGTRRPLSEGDRVFAGEQIVTGAAGSIAVAMNNGQQLTLGRDSSLNLTEQMLADSSEPQNPTIEPPPAAPSDGDLTDVEKLQAAIEAGVDPTLEGEATAAGPGAGGAGGAAGVGGGHSFVLLGETGGALDPIIGFPTEGLNNGPEFPNPDPVVGDESPDFSPTIEIIYFDQEGSVVTGPGVVEEAALNPDAISNLDGQAGSNPGSNAENVSGVLIINSPDGISAIQVLDKDGVWVNVQGGGVVQGVYGQLVFDAAGNWTYTLADNTLNHSIPDAVGADDQLLDPFFVRVFDGDGDVSPTVPLTIAVYDDGPSILRFDISEQGGLLVVDESVGTGGSTKDESGHAQNNDETGYAGSETGVIGYASFNLNSIFSLVVDPGADGENLEARTFSLNLSENAADSGLTATAGGSILLSFVGGGGADAGDILGIADGGLVVFRISINSSTGAVTVTQYAAVDHGNDGNNHDSMATIGEGLIGVTVKVFDNDGDSATSPIVELGSRIGFEDDGPQACIFLSGPWAQVTHDESSGLQNLLTSWWKPGDWDNDVSFVSAFNTVADKGSDIDPTGFARSLTPIVGTFGSSYGSDSAGATTVLSLELTGAQGSDSGLKTTDGTPINLYVEGALVVGRVASGDFAGQAAFAVAIGADGSISIAQYMSLEHPVGGSSYDEAVTLAGKIQAVVTVTDGDGDVAVDKVSIGHVIGFEDDGPVANIKAVHDVRVVHDESHGLQNASATPSSPEDANDNDINGISSLFNSVTNRGGDLSPKGYAQSNGPLVSTVGSSYGQDQEGATSKLSLAVVGGNGADSGLTTTAGFAIKLYVVNDLVVGRIVGGPDDGKAAFAVAIGADGTVSVAQYVSLEHPIGGSSYDEAVSLAGKVQAVLTVTDGDGDVAVDKVNIGSAIRFEDDGPTACIDLKGPWADVTHDETAGLQNFWTTWALGDITDNDVAFLSAFDGVVNKGSDISPTGFAKSATPVVTTLGSSYGEDEEGATTQLSLVVKNGNGDDSGLRTTDGHSITLHLEGALIVGRIVGGADAGKAAFAIAIGIDGSLSVAQYVSLEHPIGGSSFDEAVTLAGKIQAVVTVTDGDGDVAVDKVDIGSVIRFEDDGPTARISLLKNAGVTHDESAGLQNAIATPLIPGDANDNDVGDLSALFAAVAAPGTDLAPAGYAQSSGAVVSVTGSSVGQDEEGATTILSLALQGSNGMDSGLKTTDGFTIRLHVEGDFVVGRVDGGADDDKAAFAVAIDSDGKLSVVQYISLKHPDGSNADESLSLSGKIKAVLTITDGDGDVSVDKVDIGHVIRFEDDAPTAGQVTAAVVLDDEGLPGGINGGPGDVAGAAITTSGNLVFTAGADGLKSIALSGPATLGSEAVSSTWDASSNTLTISSGRGPLVTVVLTDPATGAYTINLLKPLMHPVSGTEDDITLNIGYTVTDGDNDSATGSLVVTVDDDTPTIQAGNLGVSSQVSFQGSDAGYSNSYGYYTKAADGTPVSGKVIWANVHEQSVGDVADLSGLDPANTGFFIIPNGGENSGLANGSVVTFEFVAGQWQAQLGGVPLVGADGASVLFSDASLNPGGSHLQDTGNAGNQNWEDQTLTSDYDYNDVSTNITWGSSLQVDESNFNLDATANFSGVFNVQPGADGQQSLTYKLSVQSANSGLVDTETNEAVLLSMNGTVIEGRTSGTNELVFTLSVDTAGTVKLDQLRSIVHPTSDPDEAKFLGAGHVSLTATVIDGDGDQASASLDIGTVISFKDDGPSVQPNELVKLDDDTLAGGIPDGTNDDVDALNISGTLSHDFGADGAGNVQWLTTGAPANFTYAAGPGGSLLISQGSTLVLTVTLNSTNGAYTVTQNAPILHADADQENNQAFVLNYRVTDKDGDTADGTLAINVDDDTPLAQNDVANVQANQAKDFNVVFVLDFSGSINNTELNTMLQAVRAAGQALFNGTSGDVSIQVVAFSGTAGAYPAVTNYAAFSNLISGLNPSEGGSRPFDGNTDFTAAIEQTMAVFSPVPGASNQVFFISDGNPNEQTGTGGNSLTDTTATAWNTFVDSQGVNVTTIGIGDGINNTRLQDVDLDGSGAPILVANFTDLVTTLLGQIGALVSGNVLLGSDGVAGGGDDDAFGADGAGHIQSIVINNITYVWNGSGTITPSSGSAIAGSQLSNITTAEGGKLSFNFSTGAWTYQAPSNVVGDKTETFTYTIVDKDGDPSSANLTVNVEDTSPIIAMVDEDELPGGITDSDAITTVATGNVSELVVGPSAGVQFSLSGSTAGLPAASSDGVGLVYSVAGNTLTAKAGAVGQTIFTLQVQTNGDYTFTLSGPLDHPAAGSDDNEVLVMNFASVLQASNGVDPVALAGDFLVHIENDVPTISAGSAVADSLQVDETNLSMNASVNFAASFSGNYGADGPGTTTYNLQVSASGVDSGLDDVATGNNILLYLESGNVVGRVGSAAGAVSFTVSVNASGVVTLDQQRAIAHTPNTTADQESSLASANLVQLNATIVDNDGDSSNATLNLGSAISFRDDGPSISAGVVVADSLQVDETSLATNANASFAGAFTSSYGADGAGTTTYGLNVSAAGVDSGLDDSATGSNILLFLEGNNVVGRVGGAAGAVSFTVSVNASGVVTLDQQRAIMHTPNSGPNQETSLASANLVQLTATITDRDGDSNSAAINLGDAISFRDDAPSISATAAVGNDSLQVDETVLATNATTNFAGLFSGNYGADGAGTTTYSLNVSAEGVDSGLDDSATGSNILLFNEAGMIVGRVGNAAGSVSFTVSVNASGVVNSGRLSIPRTVAQIRSPVWQRLIWCN